MKTARDRMVETIEAMTVADYLVLAATGATLEQGAIVLHGCAQATGQSPVTVALKVEMLLGNLIIRSELSRLVGVA